MKRILCIFLLMTLRASAQFPVPTEVLHNIPYCTLVPFQNSILMFEGFTKSLYKTDGISSRTLVKQFNTSSSYNESQMVGWVENQGVVFFKIIENATSSSADLFELWRTDGTDTGTYIINSSQSYWNASSMTILNNTLFYLGPDSVYAVFNNNQQVGIMSDYTFPNQTIGNLSSYKNFLLFTSSQNMKLNAWDSQTGVITQLMPVINYGSSIGYDDDYYSTVFNDTIFICPDNMFRGIAWISPDLNYGFVDTALYVNNISTVFKNKYFFNGALSTDTVMSLYNYDLPTRTLTKMFSSTGGRLIPDNFAVSNDSILFFTASDSLYGRELWQTDGTSAGTSMVIDFSPGILSSNFYWGYPGKPAALCGNYLYISETPNLASNGFHVWGGQNFSTATLKSTSEEPYDFIEFNGEYFFQLDYYSGTQNSLYKFPCALINDVESNNAPELSVYPNPASQAITVKSNSPLQGIITVKDVLGRVVSSFTSELNENSLEINVSRWQSGIYFIDYVDGKLGRKIVRFVKE